MRFFSFPFGLSFLSLFFLLSHFFFSPRWNLGNETLKLEPPNFYLIVSVYVLTSYTPSNRKEKHVWEWHAYSFTVNFHPIIKTCWYMRQLYGAFDGFLLEQGKSYTGPLILSEFGFDQNSPDNFYLDCLRDYVVGNDGDWAIWALQGSYYARNKQADFDESFGVLNRDWSDWRNSDVKNKLGKMWDTTQGP